MVSPDEAAEKSLSPELLGLDILLQATRSH